jgi:MOSC domain-containing protein YiiM
MTPLRLNGLPRVYQVSVSQGGVPKVAVSEARITRLGVEGDRQRHPDIHGGLERAVCLFSFEVIEALQAEGHPIAAGSTGENVTLAGLDWFALKPGDRIGLGSVRLELVSYTAPCVHNGRWFLKEDFGRISQKKHPGWSRLYARVLTEGVVRMGDPVTRESRAPHSHDVTSL